GDAEVRAKAAGAQSMEWTVIAVGLGEEASQFRFRLRAKIHRDGCNKNRKRLNVLGTLGKSSLNHFSSSSNGRIVRHLCRKGLERHFCRLVVRRFKLHGNPQNALP